MNVRIFFGATFQRRASSRTDRAVSGIGRRPLPLALLVHHFDTEAFQFPLRAGGQIEVTGPAASLEEQEPNGGIVAV
jgi:hypothetical protein